MSDTVCWAAIARLLSLMSAETGHAAGGSRLHMCSAPTRLHMCSAPTRLHMCSAPTRLHMCSAPTSGATVQAHMGMLRAARWLLEHEGTTVSKVMQDTG